MLFFDEHGKERLNVMRTVLFGEKVELRFSIDSKQKEIEDKNGDKKVVYTGRPCVKKSSVVVARPEILSYDGEPKYNDREDSIFGRLGTYKMINISATESVRVISTIFRADLNEFHMFTDKKEVIEVDMVETENALRRHIEDFNKAMIESNPALKAYCDLHKLYYEGTDCIDLFKIVFPCKKYKIVDGVMSIKDEFGFDKLEMATTMTSLIKAAEEINKMR